MEIFRVYEGVEKISVFLRRHRHAVVVEGIGTVSLGTSASSVDEPADNNLDSLEAIRGEVLARVFVGGIAEVCFGEFHAARLICSKGRNFGWSGFRHRVPPRGLKRPMAPAILALWALRLGDARHSHA